MSAKRLKLATIHEFDGGSLQALFDRAVQNALTDCDDRPNDESAREVCLTFSIKPISANGRTCDKVTVDASVKSKVPAYRTCAADVALRKDKGGFYGLWNPDAPEDAEQNTIPLPRPGNE